MITFPVKTNKENAAVSPLFGKAKYFAFYDGIDLTIEENTKEGGTAIVAWLVEKGVTDIIVKEMGNNPYQKILATNMNIYYAGDDRVTSEEVIELHKKKMLKKLDSSSMQEIIKKHKSSSTHSSH
jgi:predicted Fe-Mo cluster-binding NifX family protein